MSDRCCVFISYKREDQNFAEQLWQKLGEWGYDRWLDVKNIRSGISPESSTWIDAIHKGLKQSDVLIGIVTPESLKSQNVKDEWFWAKVAHRRILLLRLQPFVVEDMPPPFAATDYIDLVEDKEKGFQRLQRELENVIQERQTFKDEITPAPIASPIKDPVKDIPAYLLEKPLHRRYVPWRLTLRFLGIIALPISFLWLLTELGFEPLLASLGALAAILGSWVGAGEEIDLNRFSKLTDYEQMRKRIYQYWVQGVMQTALKEVESVGLNLHMQPEAVVRDSRKNVGDIALPNDSRHVRRVYDTFKSFLILGAPGAGKTIMLLQLAESLILKPPPTHEKAIPLVLNLSSWGLHPQPLHQWLETEVWRTYRVRGSRMRGWLENNQILLLLDGLDEVKEEQRPACVDAINIFRKDFAYVPLVVCSRILDYERLGETKLTLPGAIILEELSSAQVENYLSDPQIAHLKRAVEADTVLQKMVTTPFLLNTMIYAYRHETEAAIKGFDSEAQRREHLFNTYVQRRLADNPAPHNYQQTVAYLRWLATKMQAYVQTVFHPEDIQPDWMADDPLYQKIINAVRVAYAVILTGLYAVVGWQMGGLIGGLAWGLGGALVGGLIAYFQQFRLRSRSDEIWKLEPKFRNFLIYLVAAPAIGLLLVQVLGGQMAEWLALVLVSVGLGLLIIPLQFREDIRDWKSLGLALALSGGIGLWIGGLAWSIANSLQWSIWAEVFTAAVIVVWVVLHGFGFEEQSETPLPSALPTLRWVLLVSSAAGLMFGIIGKNLGIGIISGTAAALTYAGLFNGLTLFYLPILWLRLLQRNKLPLRMTYFLSAMSERQILRQMGGGYIFIHRYLLENFAGLDEFYVLWEQLKDNDRREKAQKFLDHLIETTPETTLRVLQGQVTWESINLHPVQRHWGIDSLIRYGKLVDNRPGVGLRSDGLPDIDWVDIPAGSFLMGSDDQHEITLSAYRISRYPITHRQFQAFLDADDGFRNPDWWKGLAANDNYRRQPGEQRFKVWNHPRENVSWWDAVAFCRWLSAKLGYEVRLPTEAEWEKAARGEGGLIYPYGNEYEATKANTSDTGIGQTSAVGLFPNGASPYGVMDMSGNVWEWCSSQYKPYPFDAADGREDLGGTDARVVRGGSFLSDRGDARAAYRNLSLLPGGRDGGIGFRVVCRPPSP